ncbi:MAG: hypothetical protein K940chlam1_00957 [Candidatus Anoxychlamydiales bacterium]|nr:hypothetical protein [Candidatus Anoxychlamydiales bacterium]NGX35843.1 hypothetical protein [Candidatus Anoxychlamydiales bacterium]
MTYFKSLIINFLTVFFVNHVIPNVEMDYYSKLPHIGGDLIFAFSLGFLNSLIYPAIILFKVKPTHFKVGLASFLISFGGYSIVNILPVGIKITAPGAYIWTSVVVWFVAYLTNHLELKRYIKEKEKENHKEDQ